MGKVSEDTEFKQPCEDGVESRVIIGPLANVCSPGGISRLT